ncbi:hypothetical protein HUJ04_011267 [Dendroctonus ponderosae]|nr:hypothetical protein HUJ04_011267 [Dendroctonus ponderosae]KAH1028497.1 hypothetical protein HUJ05_001851 [Dendroctonus ponderosae]
MSDYGVPFAKGFSLNEALCMLEDDDDILEQTNDVTMFPLQGEITEEDSGDENLVGLNNLPASQLQAPAEINMKPKPYNDDDFSSEDELPLSRLIPKKGVCNWIKKNLSTNNFYFTADDEIPHNEKLKSPLEMFQEFFDKNVINLIVLETNRYTARKNIVQNISRTEIKAFIVDVCVPRRRIYWEREKDGHNLLVSEAFTRDKFEHILTNIHVKASETVDKTDRFSKGRPLFDYLNKKFIEACPLEEMHCVGEAMVPYFGRHGCKQFIHGKPIRYGYKLWVGATRLSFVSWFEPYQGASTNISKIYSDYGVGPAVVLECADVLLKKWPDKKHHLYFDNFFTTIALIEKVSEMGLYATGTLRENRISNNPLVHSKTLKKQNRGSSDYAKIIDQDIIIVKWNDNLNWLQIPLG